MTPINKTIFDIDDMYHHRRSPAQALADVLTRSLGSWVFFGAIFFALFFWGFLMALGWLSHDFFPIWACLEIPLVGSLLMMRLRRLEERDRLAILHEHQMQREILHKQEEACASLQRLEEPGECLTPAFLHHHMRRILIFSGEEGKQQEGCITSSGEVIIFTLPTRRYDTILHLKEREQDISSIYHIDE